MPAASLRNAEIVAVRRRVFRAVRRARDMTPEQAAEGLGTPRRTYQYFESGEARLDLRRLERFADVVGVDPTTLLLALIFDEPRFALRCADNRLGAVLQDFAATLNSRLGDALSTMDADTLNEVLGDALLRLEAVAQRRAAALPTWPSR